MISVITQGASAATLILLGTQVTTHNTLSGVAFKFLPIALGVVCGADAYGRFMGWVQ